MLLLLRMFAQSILWRKTSYLWVYSDINLPICHIHSSTLFLFVCFISYLVGNLNSQVKKMPEPQTHYLAAGLCLNCLCDTAGEMIKAAYLYTFTLVRAHKNAPLLHALVCSYVIGMCFLLDPSKCAEVVTTLTRRGTFSRRLLFITPV